MMKLLKRASGSQEETDLKDLTDKIEKIQERSDMFQRSIETMLQFIKAFAINVDEIQSSRFKEEIQELGEKFKEPERPKKVELHFENKKQKILNFIDRQNKYIDDREKELRDIIDLLTRAMAGLNVENLEFYQRINRQGEKIIKISGLDDIKKIKNALKVEVDQMRQIVDLKKDQEQRQIRLLAGQVSSLQNELEAAKAKAMTDGLTGVYNRHALDDFLEDRIERYNMVGRDFSLLMIDLDDFKQINDKYGHQIGDRVLIALTQKCRNFIRGEDFLARYGGEEFTIILEGAQYRNAVKKAREICTHIAAVRYATSETQTDDYLSMTVSIGVSQYKKGDKACDLIERADKALYEAKQKGKNRAVGRKS